jgi:hypothetical protein
MLGLKSEVRDLKSDLHHIREDLRVIRIDTSLTALRDDLRQLHEMYGDLVGRVAAIEGSTPPRAGGLGQQRRDLCRRQ